MDMNLESMSRKKEWRKIQTQRTQLPAEGHRK